MCFRSHLTQHIREYARLLVFGKRIWPTGLLRKWERKQLKSQRLIGCHSCHPGGPYVKLPNVLHSLFTIYKPLTPPTNRPHRIERKMYVHSSRWNGIGTSKWMRFQLWTVRQQHKLPALHAVVPWRIMLMMLMIWHSTDRLRCYASICVLRLRFRCLFCVSFFLGQDFFVVVAVVLRGCLNSGCSLRNSCSQVASDSRKFVSHVDTLLLVEHPFHFICALRRIRFIVLIDWTHPDGISWSA